MATNSAVSPKRNRNSIAERIAREIQKSLPWDVLNEDGAEEAPPLPLLVAVVRAALQAMPPTREEQALVERAIMRVDDRDLFRLVDTIHEQEALRDMSLVEHRLFIPRVRQHIVRSLTGKGV